MLGLFLTGCRRQCHDPCGDAARNGDARSSVGGVVCCNGRAYSCVWINGGSSAAQNDKAKELISKCTEEHEDTHHDDVDCSGTGPGTIRPPFKPGVSYSAAECDGYSAEKSCLQREIANCDGDQQCISEVEAEEQNADTV